MLAVRLIPVILVNEGRIIHSEQFNHPHVIHYDPSHFIETLNRWAVDEIIFIDVTRGGHPDPKFIKYVEKLSSYCFVPLTVGGYIRDLSYAKELIKSGADKVCLNSLFELDPDKALSISMHFGRQCVVASIDVKEQGEDYCVYTLAGKQKNKNQLQQWVEHVEKFGAGEILINSIDRDGMQVGYDLNLIKIIKKSTNLPVIAVGGADQCKHLFEGWDAGADALAAANVFHYKEHVAKKLKNCLSEKKVPVRIENFQNIIN